MRAGKIFKVDRRTFLRLAGASALGAAITPRLGSARALHQRAHESVLGLANTDRIPHIQHVVVLMMENHSFDNVLGSLRRPGLDGLTFVRGKAVNSNPDTKGHPVRAFHLPTTCQDGFHVTQSWDATHKQWNRGAMDGFVATSGVEAMGYYTENDLPATHALAKVFPVCDRWFCSTMCQTFPNRMFLLAATSQGSIKTDVQERAASSPPPGGTIFDRLSARGISWKNYAGDLGDTMLWGPRYFAEQQGHFFPVADYFADAAAGTLPAFSMIDPEAEQGSQENPQDVAVGDAYVGAIASALMQSPAWGSSVLIVTYDEHGGYYDHVPPVRLPPPDGFRPLTANDYGDRFSYSGLRVPTIIASPWAKPNFVSHRVYDHTSVLKFLEYKWNLRPLTLRDRAAANILDVFDFSRPAFASPPQLPPTNVASKAVECLQHGQTGISTP